MELGSHREILSNQTEIRLYLSLSDCIWTKRSSVLFQINRKMVNIIWFRFDLIIFRKAFSAGCSKRDEWRVFSPQDHLRHPQLHRSWGAEQAGPHLPVRYLGHRLHHVSITNNWLEIIRNKESRGSSIRVKITYVLHGTIYSIFPFYMRTVQSNIRNLIQTLDKIIGTLPFLVLYLGRPTRLLRLLEVLPCFWNSDMVLDKVALEKPKNSAVLVIEAPAMRAPTICLFF